jgi:hypothetical protein
MGAGGGKGSFLFSEAFDEFYGIKVLRMKLIKRRSRCFKALEQY